MRNKILERNFFFGLLLGTLALTLFMVKSLWVVIVLSISFAMVLYPIQRFFLKHGLSSRFSSILVVTIFILILCAPLVGVGTIILNQSEQAYSFIAGGSSPLPFVESVEESLNKLLPAGFGVDVEAKFEELILYIKDNLANIFSSTISAFFYFMIMILSIYYLLKNGPKWKAILMGFSPLSDANDKKIIDKIHQTVNGVMKGYLLIGIIQGTLMGLGLWFVGVPNPALWGLATVLASMIPMVGTSLVSVPAIIYLLFIGNPLGALILALWTGLMVGTIDNILSPYLVSGQIKIHPLFVLFAVIGGLTLMGPIGILVGPLVVSLLYALMSIYQDQFKNIADVS